MFNSPIAAACASNSSGQLAQRKYESLVASSLGVISRTRISASGSASTRKRNSGWTKSVVIIVRNSALNVGDGPSGLQTLLKSFRSESVASRRSIRSTNQFALMFRRESPVFVPMRASSVCRHEGVMYGSSGPSIVTTHTRALRSLAALSGPAFSKKSLLKEIAIVCEPAFSGTSDRRTPGAEKVSVTVNSSSRCLSTIKLMRTGSGPACCPATRLVMAYRPARGIFIFANASPLDQSSAPFFCFAPFPLVISIASP